MTVYNVSVNQRISQTKYRYNIARKVLAISTSFGSRSSKLNLAAARKKKGISSPRDCARIKSHLPLGASTRAH